MRKVLLDDDAEAGAEVEEECWGVSEKSLVTKAAMDSHETHRKRVKVLQMCNPEFGMEPDFLERAGTLIAFWMLVT